MRFLADGPSIPDDLLVARDAGDVIFFCGAGVSRHRAGLPDFLKLGGDVVDLLGAGEKSLARKLFRRVKALDPIDGVGGLTATDRIFGLLEREFEQRDVQNAVARAIKPADDPDLSAHRTLIDLSRGRDGTVRLVTTNFDLLFEAADSNIICSGPPVLPDPRSAGFGGIVHLHGRVDADYLGLGDEEFIVSSADFGRAYLSDGWATRFMQSLLARFQIVFVGYGADDPPVQYLLEALSLRAGNRSRLFAFQAGSNADDAALWEHRGVRAIPFDNSQAMIPCGTASRPGPNARATLMAGTPGCSIPHLQDRPHSTRTCAVRSRMCSRPERAPGASASLTRRSPLHGCSHSIRASASTNPVP